MRSLLLLLVFAVGILVGAVTVSLLSGPGAAADCPGEPGVVCGNGDVNGDGLINISDVIHLARHLFGDGREVAQIRCSGWALPASPG